VESFVTVAESDAVAVMEMLVGGGGAKAMAIF
jgi:hypothetical protein